MVPAIPLKADGISEQFAKGGDATVMKPASGLCQTQSFKKYSGELK